MDERQTTSQDAAGWLLLYSVAAFYGTRYALTHFLHIDGFPNTWGSVVATVLVVNVIIFLYALRGYEEAKEDDHREPQQNEQDDDANDEAKKLK